MGKLKKAYLEITNVCNLSCSFCPGTRRPTGFLSPAGFRKLAGKLRPHVKYLYLHLMGEPLLHPHLEELLSIAEELEFKVIITTNGTLLPRQEALLCASLAIHKVSISLHSFEANETDHSFADYLTGCCDFARSASAAGKHCALRLWNLDGETTKGANSQNRHILDHLKKVFPEPWQDNRNGSTLVPRVYLEWGEKFDWPDLDASQSGSTGFCYGLRDQVGVLWDGTVVPCCLDHEGDIPLGNLYTQTLEEILDTPRARAIYDGFTRRRPVEPLCQRCGYIRRFH